MITLLITRDLLNTSDIPEKMSVVLNRYLKVAGVKHSETCLDAIEYYAGL